MGETSPSEQISKDFALAMQLTVGPNDETVRGHVELMKSNRELAAFLSRSTKHSRARVIVETTETAGVTEITVEDWQRIGYANRAEFKRLTGV